MNTPRIANSPTFQKLGRVIPLIAALGAGAIASRCLAEDWGAYSLVPASAQAMVLEAVGSGTDEGTAISLGKPAGTANQKWVITPKGDNFYTIKPSSSSTLVLAVEKGEAAKIGSSIVLEKENGQPWQLWALTKRENGSYGLTPKNAPELGLDDLGGKHTPGAMIDLWKSLPNDQHLQWMIKAARGKRPPGGAGGSCQQALRAAGHQTRGRAAGRHQTILLHGKRHFSWHGARRHGLHSRPIRREQAGLRLCQDRWL